MKNKKLFAILTLVCFMMTLMPVAAFAADTDLSHGASAIYTVDSDASASVNEPVEIVFALNDKKGDTVATTDQVYVWATAGNTAVPTDALSGADNNGVLTINNVNNGIKIVDAVKFLRPGVYNLHAAFEMPTFENGKIAAAKELSTSTNKNTVEVTGTAKDPYTNYKASVDANPTWDNAKSYLDEMTLNTVTPNNVAEEVTVTFFNDGKKLAAGKTVAIDTNSANISVDKATATVDVLGQITFNVSASREGNYYIYLTVDGVEFRVKIGADNTSAAYIETIAQPKAPKALYGALPTVRFQVTDINGNIVKNANDNNTQGMVGIFGNDGTNALYKGKYVVLTEKPKASKLTSKDFTLKWNENKSAYDLVLADTASTKIMDAEGTYEFKVILDNGDYATASFEIKKFQTPVELRIDYNATTVELGGVIAPSQVVYVDANGVEKQASDADLAATGYAIEYFGDYKYFVNADGNIVADGTNGATSKTVSNAVVVKSDEKYVGAEITVTAVSERYNLVDTVTLKVAEGASAIDFADKTAAVNVNNKILWNIVDSEGNKVALTTTDKTAVNVTDIKYVVLDKPEGAKVSVYDATIKSDLLQKGEGKMALTSNKVGNVTVQAIVKAEYKAGTTSTTETVNQVKYYTGTQIFAVGTEGVGDVVVMSVGSNEIVINDKKATIDAAPIVKNDRTFVPFRALAEAFGAEVAYDEATQAVTAELNGTTVVMTIGSATYTVNGAEKTMDVAPFINGSRTMVPVRFVAEAFGIKVIPTYDENGATADILFNL